MNQKLSISSAVVIGSMLFGLYFGAGNLIFPIHMGQEAGSDWLVANLGFLITAIGLPFLGAVAIGYSNSAGCFDLASHVDKRYAKIFTILLYITIGPAFAIPRNASVAYQIGLSSLVGDSYQTIALAIFSAIFFLIALLFSLKPSRLMVYIGKGLNPLFLLFLALLVISAFLAPMGNPSTALTTGAYIDHPFSKGVTEGYNTMDVLASLAFAILVVNAMKGIGITEPKEIAIGMVKAGFVVVLLMAVIYTALTYLGADSLGTFAMAKNGGITMNQMATHYFNSYGAILLAIILTLACLKTSIGLICACSETFEELFPNSVNYRTYVFIFTFISFLAANMGLNEIITLAIPVLMFLYPLSISLVIAAFVAPQFGNRRIVYALPVLLSGIAAIGDMLVALPDSLKNLASVKQVISIFQHLPMFDLGMSWIIPTIIGFIIAIIYTLVNKNSQEN